MAEGDYANFCGTTYIDVEEGNEHFCSVGGVLYSKELTKLLWCPKEKNGSLVIPESVTSIEFLSL